MNDIALYIFELQVFFCQLVNRLSESTLDPARVYAGVCIVDNN